MISMMVGSVPASKAKQVAKKRIIKQPAKTKKRSSSLNILN
jgi:hypothetical protein